MLKLYNSLTRRKEDFQPLNPPKVGFYTCGQTVYDHTHLGHIKKYIGDDLIRRTLEYLGYEVFHVQNVTDVGHLESDADEGEDKLEKGSRKLGVDVLQLARKFEDEFYADLKEVNTLHPHVVQNAADIKSINEQVRLIAVLLDKQYAYLTDSAIYFDVAKLPDYNPFSHQPLTEKIAGSREDIVIDNNKHNPADFALWIFRKGIHANHALYWNTPWGDGFPGWHIECSAISMQNLGAYIDIHTGGIDHLLVHHPNEIAQNYGVTGHKVVNYWVHHEFMMVDGRKMSKSLGNYYTLNDVKNRGFDPLAMRYFVMNAHYRKQINFTWEALTAANHAFMNLKKLVLKYKEIAIEPVINSTYKARFEDALNDDINTPQTLSLLWEVVEGNSKDEEKLGFILQADKVWGLKLGELERVIIPVEIMNLAQKRFNLRIEKKFTEADQVRTQIEESGFIVIDTPTETRVEPKV